MALLETPGLSKLNKIPCAFQQSCPCLCTSFCPNSHGVERWGTLGTQVLKPLSHHEVPHLQSGSVGSTHRAPLQCGWRVFSRHHNIIWWDWGSGAALAAGVWKSGVLGHPLPNVVGNLYGLKAHPWEPQLSALEREASEIWELKSSEDVASQPVGSKVLLNVGQ